MEITRNGSRPSGKGPAAYFTGAVRVDPLFGPPEPARAIGASVTFAPGARTAWPAHPLGQTLIVTAGAAGYSARADRSRKSGRATWSGSRRASSTGTERRQPRP
jgi:quercetin dioxygenase-like cupin family protein